MRVPSLTLVAASAALLAPTAFPGAAPAALPVAPRPQLGTALPPHAGPARTETGPVRAGRSGIRVAPLTSPPPSAPGPVPPSQVRPGKREDAGRTEPVRAADLLAKVKDCTPVSKGRYRSDAGAPADIPVCGTRDAVYWKADLDVDCDGRPGDRCNSRTDPHFSPATAFTRSDGRALDAERLPYVVVPQPSERWDHREDDVRGGSLAAVVHGDRVGYAVVGDIGPRGLIGEASYAAARLLGIPADPRTGGAASDVTYIVFKGSEIDPIEDTAQAERTGERLAREFVAGD